MCGRASVDPLHPGRDGPPGFSQITVLFDDGTSAAYHSRYMLEVVEFDVLDENGDGIYEPGEHIIVSNIVIKNTGWSDDVLDTLWMLTGTGQARCPRRELQSFRS